MVMGMGCLRLPGIRFSDRGANRNGKENERLKG